MRRTMLGELMRVVVVVGVRVHEDLKLEIAQVVAPSPVLTTIYHTYTAQY